MMPAAPLFTFFRPMLLNRHAFRRLSLFVLAAALAGCATTATQPTGGTPAAVVAPYQETIELSGRLPGAMAFFSPAISPNIFGAPGCAEKSSISLFIMIPVPSGTNAAPKLSLIVVVTATEFPNLSTTEKCVVF